MNHGLNASLLHLLHRALQTANELFEDEHGAGGVTPRQFVVLAAIASREGLSQTDIVDLTGVDRSTIADVVRRIQRKGLIARKRKRSDVRAYEVKLTAKGREALEAARRVTTITENKLAAKLTPRQRDELLRMLKLLADASSEGKS